jgi:hypothetical protein
MVIDGQTETALLVPPYSVLFCGTCGIRSWSHGAGKDGKESVAINLRCLAGFEWTGLPVETFDGASL